MKEGYIMPEKFNYVPLYLQFDSTTKIQYLRMFVENIRSNTASELFRKGVTICTTGTGINTFYFKLIMKALKV